MDGSANPRLVKVSFELPAESAAPAAVLSAPATPKESASRPAAEPNTQTPASPNNSLQPFSRIGRPPALEGKRIYRIDIYGLSDQARSDLMSRLQVHVGDTFAADTMDRVRAEVRAFDEHLNVGIGINSNGEVSLNIQMPGTGGTLGGIVTSVPSAVPPAADGTRRITIGGNVQQAKLISQPKPVYPPLAKQAHISGIVHLQAVIGKEGNVIDLAVIDGHPLLITSAMDAVRQWVYKTTLLNGEPVEVMTQIDVNYTLSDSPPVQQ
jgi:hypothetical protein